MFVPPLLREDPRFRRFWLGQSVSLLGDQVSLIALPLVAVLALDASAAQMGYLVAAELPPNLLFSLHAGAWADQRSAEAAHHDRDRPRPGAADRLAAGRLGVRRAHVPAHAGRRVPDGVAERPLPGLLQPALRRARATRAVDRGRLDHAREPRSFLRRRAEHRRPARAGDLGAGRPRRRRLLLRRLGPLPPDRRGRGTGARGPGEGPCRRGRALGVRQPDRPRGAGCHRHDQLLQFRLRRALHPLRETDRSASSRDRSGSSSAPARSAASSARS